MLTFHEKFLPNIFIGNITLHSVYSVIVPPPALKSFNTLNWRLNFYNWSQWVECWTLHKLVQLLKLMPPPSPSPAKLKTAPWLIKYFLSFHRSYFLYGICHPPNEFHSIARGLFWFNVNISLIWIKWYILAAMAGPPSLHTTAALGFIHFIRTVTATRSIIICRSDLKIWDFTSKENH